MKKQKIIIGILTLSIVAVVSGFFAYIYTNTKVWTDLIYPGVKVEDEDLGGKTKNQAKKILKEKYSDAILNKSLIVKLPDSDKNYQIEYSKIDAKYNIDEVINEAFSYGKKSSLLKKYKLINKPQNKVFKLNFSYDSKPIKNFVSQIEKEVNKQPTNAKLNFSGGGFQVIPDKPGVKLKTEKLEKDMLSKINGDISDNAVVEAPIENINAKITADKLSTINTKISSYSTSYLGSSSERSNNIVLATNTINGTVVMPGETFSFNGVVGQRTAERGYKAAPVIIGNKVDSGLGGGTCQVSTTLYNAILRANIKASERSHHTVPSNYIGLGMDATVDYGNIDYKFVNSLPYPIYIEGYAANGTLGFNIYSNSKLAEKSYDIVNEVYETLEPSVQYVDDPDMAVGETAEEQSPSQGYKVRVYKNAYQNGKLIDRELVSNDIYLPINKVIKRGTKK